MNRSDLTRAAIAVVLLLLFALPACATQGLPRKEWSHYRLGAVDVYSGLSERRAHKVLYDLARYRVVLGSLTGTPDAEPSVPTRIYLFPDAYSYERYTQQHNRKSNGYFVNDRAALTLAINASRGSAAGEEVLYWAFAQILLSGDSSAGLPIWLNVGMAEVYATIRFVGNDVRFGDISSRNRLAVGQYNHWLPMEDLLRGDVLRERRDPVKVHQHHAQAWLMSHYVLLGARAENGELDEYVRLVKAGGDPVASIRPAFGVSVHDLEAEARNYLRNEEIVYQLVPQQQFDFSGITIQGSALSPGQAAVHLAVLAARMRNMDRAAALADAAIADGQTGPDIDWLQSVLPPAP